MKTTKGLSPRVRGNPGSWYLTDLRHRSIPACAGEPPKRQAGYRRHKVYPACAGEPRGGAPSLLHR